MNEGKTDLTIKTQEGLSPQDEGKTRNLTNEEVVKGILEGEKLIRQSRAGTETTTQTTRKFTQTEPKADDIPGVTAAEKNLADVSNMEIKPRATFRVQK